MYVTLCDVMCCGRGCRCLGPTYNKTGPEGSEDTYRVQNSVRGIHTRRGPDGRF